MKNPFKILEERFTKWLRSLTTPECSICYRPAVQEDSGMLFCKEHKAIFLDEPKKFKNGRIVRQKPRV